jgi:hypothetical protein
MIYFIKFEISNQPPYRLFSHLNYRESQRAQLYGHFAPFFSFYNFNNVRIVTNKIFKNTFKIKKLFLFFLRPKDIKKVLMEGNGRENKKMVPTLTTLP